MKQHTTGARFLLVEETDASRKYFQKTTGTYWITYKFTIKNRCTQLLQGDVLEMAKVICMFIRRYLHANEIQSYLAAAKPYLSAKHIADRLNWCITWQQWATTPWDSAAFTD